MMFKKRIIGCSVAGALLAMAGNAAASGFGLLEQSASGLGNAYAGGAAGAEDATTIFFNPAGMSRLSGKQIVVGATAIKPTGKFAGTVTGLAPLQVAGTGAGGDAGSWELVPNAYFAMEVNPRTRVGLGINAPFGLQTEYDPAWMGRYQGIKSRLETINLNPSISYQVNDTVTLGAGVNYQRIKGVLTSMTNFSAAAFAAGAGVFALVGANKEGLSTLTGSDTAWGYNLGALINVSPVTRVGVAYRSRLKYNLGGTVTFANRPAALAAALPDQAVTLAVTTPDIFSVSAVHQLDDKWEIMGDATWTGWSVFQQLNVLKMNGTSLSVPTPENWKDTWRISAGASYRYNSQWLARMGVGYDQTPISDAYRTVRIPDQDRYQIALGGQYKPTRDSAIDFSYSHLFMRNAAVNQNAAVNTDLAGKGLLSGSFKVSADILSVQYTYGF
ncbi:fatty acid transporter [Ferrigenium kumadai]|uniref:Fatty acid transporter n=1 Tax=Ferrigenium kumadai TaxID=1682490 RepID=A0AAN1VZ94_9PROT|nr:outer membrane protein transport protein [Ferrigenium kumadai]BBI99123.1 fatty acid transporter [Ferrigenium kumadai]